MAEENKEFGAFFVGMLAKSLELANEVYNAATPENQPQIVEETAKGLEGLSKRLEAIHQEFGIPKELTAEQTTVFTDLIQRVRDGHVLGRG